MQGRVIAIDGSKITVMPKHEDLKDPLEFQANELKKYFRQVKSLIKMSLDLVMEHSPFSRATTSELLAVVTRETQVSLFAWRII